MASDPVPAQKIEGQTGGLVKLSKTLVKASPAFLKRKTWPEDTQALPAVQKDGQPALIQLEKTSARQIS